MSLLWQISDRKKEGTVWNLKGVNSQISKREPDTVIIVLWNKCLCPLKIYTPKALSLSVFGGGLQEVILFG